MSNNGLEDKLDSAIASRFQIRDETLDKALEELAVRTRNNYDEDWPTALGIKLRLVCEQDLYERAYIVWQALRKDHESAGKVKTASLMKDFRASMRKHMQLASLNLANHLRKYSEDLEPAFTSKNALDAAWLARLRDRASERYAKDMNEYVSRLNWGLRNLVGGFKRKKSSTPEVQPQPVEALDDALPDVAPDESE